MDKIRIDQSHCNYHLSRWLTNQGWEVLFTDAGRVTRGGIGSQGDFLRIFESNRLPIPDIVLLKDSTLLLIEIDSTFKKVQKSLQTYQTNSALILSSVNQNTTNDQLNILERGFCFTNLKSQSFLIRINKSQFDSCDTLFYFTQPKEPTMLSIRN